MSLDLYSSLLQPHQPAPALPPPPPPPKYKPLTASSNDLSAVEERLLAFFPTALNHVSSSTPTLPGPTHSAPPAAATKMVVPPTPKLLSALHTRTPSISPFARMGLDYVDDGDGVGGVLKEADEESAEAEEVAGVNGRDVKQATAELVYATRQRRSTLRDKMAHSGRPASLSASQKSDESAALASAVPATAITEQPQRGRRIISNARMMNAANRPTLHTAAPLAPNSPLSPPPPSAVSQPTSPAAESISSDMEDGSARPNKKKRQPTAFLSQLAGMIKTPMTAAPPAIPRYHATVEAVADAQQPASPTAATAAASIEQSRAAAEVLRQAAKQTTEPTNSKQTIPTAAADIETTQTEATPTPKSPAQQMPASEDIKSRSKAVVVARSSSPEPAAAPAPHSKPQEVQEETKVKHDTEDEDSWDDSEDESEDGDAYSSSASDSDSTHQRIASSSDSDSDTFMRSLSSMWTTAKRRQDKLIGKQQRQAAERTEQRMYGKTLLNGGIIVEREGGRIKKEVRRAVRSGRRRDGAKLTLEERKAMKMAAVYRQQGQTVKKAAPKQEEKREQEEADDQPQRPLTPQAATRVLTAPASNTSRSSPSSPRRRSAAPASTTPFIPVRYDAPAMPAEPLPTRLPTEVAFGRNTALTADEAVKRQKKSQGRGPSLFDLAYGTAVVEADGAEKMHKKKTAKWLEEEDDTALPYIPAAPIVLPARVLRAPPPVSTHIISEGVAAGLPFSIRAIKRRSTPSSAFVVPADAHVTVIAQQAIRQHKHNAPPPPSTAINSSTLSHKSISFPRSPRSPQPPKHTQPTSSTSQQQQHQQQQPPRRPRMAAKTKAHLDRLHAAHLEQQQRLTRERAEKEERALEGCTFVPQLAAKSEKMAERRRMQDEVQMRLYDMMKGRKQKEKEGKRGAEEAQAEVEAEDDAPISWGWQDAPADQLPPAPAAAADGHQSTGRTSTTTPAGASSAGSREKLSRAEVMYAQHRIQQERLKEMKQVEDEQRAQQQLAQCTFVPRTNSYGPPSDSSNPTSAVHHDQATASATLAEEESVDQSQTVPVMVVQKMHTSYEEQFERANSRRQSHAAPQQQQPTMEQQQAEASHVTQPSTLIDEQREDAEISEDEDDLFATAETAAAQSAAPSAVPAVASAAAKRTSLRAADDAATGQSDIHAAIAAWPVPVVDDEHSDCETDQHGQEQHMEAESEAVTDRSVAVEAAEPRDSIHTSFAWAVPAFATDTGEDELESPVHSYPEVVEADEWQRERAEETDEELDELLNTAELAQFRNTLLAEQLHTLDNETAHTAPSASSEQQTAEDSNHQPVQQEPQSKQEDSHPSATANTSRTLLFVDIALSADRVERMQLCDGDDLLRCASDFCAKHDLHADYVPLIEDMLHQRLQQSWS